MLLIAVLNIELIRIKKKKRRLTVILERLVSEHYCELAVPLIFCEDCTRPIGLMKDRRFRGFTILNCCRNVGIIRVWIFCRRD
jgi:hypothetical protein